MNQLSTNLYRPAFSERLTFSDLPEAIQKKVLEDILTEMPWGWPKNHDSYLLGRSAGVEWLLNASLAEISLVASSGPNVSYQWSESMDQVDEEITYPSNSYATNVVKDLIGLKEWSSASKEHIQYEGGFYQLINDVERVLLQLIQITRDESKS